MLEYPSAAEAGEPLAGRGCQFRAGAPGSERALGLSFVILYRNKTRCTSTRRICVPSIVSAMTSRLEEEYVCQRTSHLRAGRVSLDCIAPAPLSHRVLLALHWSTKWHT